VLDLAKRLYRARGLQRIDGHTLQVEAEGISWIPVPAGAQLNHAGLLTVDLPAGIHKGQRFHAVARQVTHTGRVRRTTGGGGIDSAADAFLTVRGTVATGAAGSSKVVIWQEVLGAFQVTIPISSRALLLDAEGRLLSLLRWILGTIPHADRWYLPFRRYVAEIGQRFHGFGGDPGTVVADPNGLPGGVGEPGGGAGEPGFPGGGKALAFTGKVSSLLYDRWGDFEGFTLDTEAGERLFRSREHTIEDIANRAWTERILVVVYARAGDPHRPERIVFKYAPRPYWG